MGVLRARSLCRWNNRSVKRRRAMLRVFVVSPLPAIRAGLRALIDGAEDCEVVGEADRMQLVRTPSLGPRLDVVVVDGQPGLEIGDVTFADVTPSGPGLVILGPVTDDERLPIDLAGRPWAYVPREASADQLVAAVRAVANGLTAIDPNLGGHLLAKLAVAGDSATLDGDDLTAREREVLQLVALGLANKAIAARLGISEHTVKFHVAAVLAKLGAGSRTEAVHLGARRGLVVL